MKKMKIPMSKNLLYLDYIVRHKWYVFLAGLKTKAPLWRLIIHDWSKLTPGEWLAYREYFYGSKENKARNKERFTSAWNHHIHTNKHHWQYWCVLDDPSTTSESISLDALEMPIKHVREMVADWMGAGRAITGRWEAKEWYEKRKNKIILHPETRKMVEQLLS